MPDIDAVYAGLGITFNARTDSDYTVFWASGLSSTLPVLLSATVLLVGFAKLFRFDLYLCGISSLAHIGGVAATPVLAASYSRALVPVGILLALLGYILGTGFGLLVASIMSTLAGS